MKSFFVALVSCIIAGVMMTACERHTQKPEEFNFESFAGKNQVFQMAFDKSSGECAFLVGQTVIPDQENTVEIIEGKDGSISWIVDGVTISLPPNSFYFFDGRSIYTGKARFSREQWQGYKENNKSPSKYSIEEIKQYFGLELRPL